MDAQFYFLLTEICTKPLQCQYVILKIVERFFVLKKGKLSKYKTIHIFQYFLVRIKLYDVHNWSYFAEFSSKSNYAFNAIPVNLGADSATNPNAKIESHWDSDNRIPYRIRIWVRFNMKLT